MDTNAFDEIIMEVIRPSLRDVIRKYQAQLNPSYSNEKLAYAAIYTEYDRAIRDVKSAMLKQGEATLDPHKEGVCLCCAIVKSRVLVECAWENRTDENDPYRRAYLYPNELFAFTAAMRIIKDSMFADPHLAHDDEMCRIIAKNVPYYPGKLADTFGYLSNTIFYIRRFATKGTTSEFLFDTGAYSTIFYHLDRENRRYVKKLYAEEIAQKAV